MPESTIQEPGQLMSHAFLLLDGSGSMTDPELRTGKPKHRAVAEMVQDLIRTLKDDDQIQDLLLTMICYDSNRVDDVRLRAYDVKQSEDYYRQPPYDSKDLDRWDPIVGHGGATPIGRALAFAREMAEEWVKSAPKGVVHRAIIWLFTDGMNYPESEPNGVDERNRIVDFTNAQEEQRKQGAEYKGRIRIASVGYYQFPDPENPNLSDEDKRQLQQAPKDKLEEEAKGRRLLKALAFPDHLHFESGDARRLAWFFTKTQKAEGK